MARICRRALFFFILIIGLPLLASPKDLDWRKEALHVVGGGDQRRQKAVRRLESWPSLDAELKAALEGPDRFLALDVIAALRRKALVEDVMAFSRKDTSGFSYLTLNTFIESSNLKTFSKLYLEIVSDPKAPSSAKVIALDTLSRMQVGVDEDVLEESLFASDSPEVRSAALSYMRHFLVTRKNDAYLELFGKFMKTGGLSEQLKIQALFLYSELPDRFVRKTGSVALLCSSRIPSELKRHCAKAAAP